MSEAVIIGNATLYLADCREVLPALGRMDAVITDPPYGAGMYVSRPMNYQRMKGMTGSAWDNDRFEGFDDVLAKAPIQIIWGGNYYADVLPASRGWLVWHKPDAVPTMANVELAWTSIDMNSRAFVKSVKSTSLEKDQGAQHPTQKPISLMQWCIEQAGMPMNVCDPFMGSGTTGVAALRMGRSFIGIERDPRYFAIACRRIEDAQRQEPLFAWDSAEAPEQGALL